MNEAVSTQHAIQYVQKSLLSDKNNAKALKQRPSLTYKIFENPKQEERPEWAMDEGPVIVYGNNLHAYACIQGLLDMGMPGLRIIMAHPEVPEGVGYH